MLTSARSDRVEGPSFAAGSQAVAIMSSATCSGCMSNSNSAAGFALLTSALEAAVGVLCTPPAAWRREAGGCRWRHIAAQRRVAAIMACVRGLLATRAFLPCPHLPLVW